MNRIFFGLNSDAKAVRAAMNKSQAIIEFDLFGNILTANENFCRTLGYQLSEIVGQNHRIFVNPDEAAGEAYKVFWTRLRGGEFDQRQYKRIGKGGREIWIEASYNPVARGGKVYKVVKYATDITAIKLKAAEDAYKLEALSRSQAIIEFTPAGDILVANENFLTTLGYSATEIAGRHHSLFCEPAYVQSREYGQFWDRLRAGEFVADEFQRIGKGGKPIFIQASYNPIFDMNGKVFKIVKFATDVTDRVKNVDVLAESLRKLAGGDLTVTIEHAFIPSLAKLRLDFNEASSMLNSAMKNVGEKAGGIKVGSNEIRASADHLATRTEQQAASVEETAAALEQITTTVSDSSRRAEEAGRLVARTKENAERSGEVVREAIAAMDRIEQSSIEISTIIGVIDEIAFQTNLLALNAGVEAARAGDAGKGFAVVAHEVRQLAQRSAEAAKQIKALIRTSGEQVRSGVELVGQTGRVLQEIVKQVAEINTNVIAIVEGAREQAVGLKEINQAVNSLDQGTQQNAAMVEETTAASHGMAADANGLFTLIGQFRLQEAGFGPVIGDPEMGKRVERQPVVSIARQRANKLIRTIGRTGATAAAAEDNWQEF